MAKIILAIDLVLRIYFPDIKVKEIRKTFNNWTLLNKGYYNG